MSKPRSAVITKAGTHILEAAPSTGALEIIEGQFSVRANNTVTFPFYDPPLSEEATTGRDIKIMPVQLKRGEDFTVTTTTTAKTTFKWRFRVYDPAVEPEPVPVPPVPVPVPVPVPIPTPTPTPLPPPAEGILSAGDFTYLGYYDPVLALNDSGYAAALAHRYVNGQLRFMTIEMGQIDGTPTAAVYEWTVDGRPFGQDFADTTNKWMTPWNADQRVQGNYFGLWWDEAGKRLWSTHTIDYGTPQDYYPTNIYTRTLNADGTVANVKHVSLDGISSKRAYGGACAVPLWFQQKYNVGPYAVGFGGYTSLMAMASKCSLGAALFAMPDPASASATSNVLPFTTLADHVGGAVSSTDWYAGGVPTEIDRGMRLNVPINYMNDPTQPPNPTTPPTGPPGPGAQWLSPAPDGKARWVWGDNYWNTLNWIDGTSKQGVIAVGTFIAGKCWYGNAHLNADARVFELHVFDPTHLGEVATGTRKPWQVQPVAMIPLTLPGLGGAESTGGPYKAAAGATYDPVGKKLYIFGPGAGVVSPSGIAANRLFVYQVNA